ncbi:MAG: glycosyltransferase family 4 protein [Phycisphaerae bacterium]|nr:glycosyltransferase family 4 protein [Phycisphaerae bacterium]
MLIWIVNPFDPLPGDPEQEGRYATLARLLIARDHRVTWWTSSFSHRFKRPVDQTAIRAACQDCGIDVEFLEAPPYQQNVGLARVRNHAVLARHFYAAATRSSPRPDVIVVSSPPPVLAYHAVRLARERGVKSIIDVQDLWPDAFSCLVPPLARPLLAPAIWMMRRNVRRAAIGCDAIVGVADAYVENSHKEAGETKITATIPLGVDLAALDAAAAAGKCDEYTKPAGEIWLAYTGSLNRNYDFMTILKAAARIGDSLGPGLRFFLTGRGELAEQTKQFVREHKLTNVTLTGFLDFETWAYLLYQCDAGFNASFPEAMIFLPNKIFYYLAAGAAVLNTIPGQCSRIVRDGGCGLDYEAANVDSCVAAIEQIVRDADTRHAMQQAARKLVETTYDRVILFPKFAELIERVREGIRAPA